MVEIKYIPTICPYCGTGCGLNFVVKCADFYDVSCDYLLGRSAEKNGNQISVNEIPSESWKRICPQIYRTCSGRGYQNVEHILFRLYWNR